MASGAVVNRLLEIRGGATGEDLESAQPLNDSGTPSFMIDCYQQVEEIKTLLSRIETNTQVIQDKYNQLITSTDLHDGDKGAAVLDKLLQGNNALCKDITTRLKALDDANQAFNAGEGKARVAEQKIRQNMRDMLAKKFNDVMKNYQEVQARYKSGYQEIVKRHFKIAYPQLPDAEIESLIEKGETAGGVFTKQLLDKRVAASNALGYIQQKHQDIKNIEASILELQQVFVDMAILVESQGELIDQIEYNVGSTLEYTDQARRELNSAKKNAASARKKMCLIIVIVLVVLGVILWPVISSVKSN